MVRNLKGKRPEYFEAILQLRDCTEEVRGFVISKIAKNNIGVAKDLKVKGGWDLYLSDNNFTRALGKKLQDKFGGKVQMSASLWGKKEGKEVYRVTVLFRLAGFIKGDIVEYGGEEYKVKMMLEKDILLQHTKTGEKVHVKYKEMGKIKKIK